MYRIFGCKILFDFSLLHDYIIIDLYNTESADYDRKCSEASAEWNGAIRWQYIPRYGYNRYTVAHDRNKVLAPLVIHANCVYLTNQIKDKSKFKYNVCNTFNVHDIGNPNHFHLVYKDGAETHEQHQTISTDNKARLDNAKHTNFNNICQKYFNTVVDMNTVMKVKKKYVVKIRSELNI